MAATPPASFGRIVAATILALCVIILITAPSPALAEKAPLKGEVRFTPSATEAELPAFFQLQPHSFPFEQTFLPTGSTRTELSLVTFPSPVKTPHENNNTVHCEYFQSLGEGKRPAVVVLHILGGDFDLARLFCTQLASTGTSALFLKMPYYGPRRQPDLPNRMISPDPKETVAGMKQAVLDIRRGVAWLAAREEVDAEQLGIFGISLGGITGALAATVEPRISKACLMLAGGDVAQVAWTSPEMGKLRGKWVENGGTKESFFELLKAVDPVTYSARMKGRQVLMLNASRDEVIPKACTESLWKAFGEPEIVWYDAGHYSVMRHILDGLGRVTKFFQPTPTP